ncbi:MAG: hypothetical protein ACR2FH_10685, partial [Caulobacteraceae bacterium]
MVTDDRPAPRGSPPAAQTLRPRFMRLIERYLFGQLLGPTLLATAALCAVAVLSQLISGLDIV